MSIKLLNTLSEEVSEQLRHLYNPYIQNPETGKYEKNLGWNERENRPNRESDFVRSEKYSRVYDVVDTSKYPNIDFASRTKKDPINPYLLKDINTAAEKSGIRVQITYAITDHPKGEDTRHDEGEAVDLSILNGKGSSSSDFLTLGDKVVEELKKLGYTFGEKGCGKSYLWRTKDHYDHIHVSSKPC